MASSGFPALLCFWRDFWCGVELDLFACESKTCVGRRLWHQCCDHGMALWHFCTSGRFGGIIRFDHRHDERHLGCSTDEPCFGATASSPRLTLAHRLVVDRRRTACPGGSTQFVLTSETSHHPGWLPAQFGVLQKPTQDGGDDNCV